MLKRLLTALLPSSMLVSGSSLPVLANAQDPEIEEMESAIKIQETLMKDPYSDESLGLYEKDGLVYQLFSDGNAQVEGGENSTITELYIPSHINFNGEDYKISTIGHVADYNKYGLGKFRPRFTGLPNLKKVTIEEGIESITVSAFSHCLNLETVSLPKSITWYGSDSFSSCPKLRNIFLSNQAAIAKGMFYGCTSLEEIIIPDGVPSLARSAFENCPNLKKVIIPTSVKAFGGEEQEVWYIFLNSPNVTIYGYIPSEAYNYAQKHGISFKELNSELLPNIPSSGEMYRLYNPNSGEHFYTGNPNEKNQLSSIGWKDEGVAWYSPQSSNTPVYRLYNKNSSDHHYTTDSKEKDTLVRSGWKDEGIGWYSDDAKTVPLYRIYNPNTQKAGSHHYTTDQNERNSLISRGWKNEGIAWYGLK